MFWGIWGLFFLLWNIFFQYLILKFWVCNFCLFLRKLPLPPSWKNVITHKTWSASENHPSYHTHFMTFKWSWVHSRLYKGRCLRAGLCYTAFNWLERMVQGFRVTWPNQSQRDSAVACVGSWWVGKQSLRGQQSCCGKGTDQGHALHLKMMKL